MEYFRYSISELARKTKTRREILSGWVKKGYLTPTQIVGARFKFSMDAFLKAEQLALKDAMLDRSIERKEVLRTIEKKRRKMTSYLPNFDMPPVGAKVPDSWFDNLDIICQS